MLRRELAVSVAALALVAGCATGDAGASEQRRLTGVENLRQVAQLTGPDSPNKTDAVAVAGTDLGSMATVGDRTYFVFGDTFGQRDPGMTGGGGTDWRSNALAWTTDDDPSDGITLDGWTLDAPGHAGELVVGKKIDNDEMTKIPTHIFAADGALYLFVMSVRHWGEPGEWETNWSELVRSTDGGKTWQELTDVRWPGDSGFIQVAPYTLTVDGTPYVYFWSIPAGRSGSVRLMRVPETQVADLSAYRYYAGTTDGKETWSADLADATVVVDGPVGELSVVPNDYVGGWLMTYLDGSGDVAVRHGASPTGPWDEPIVLVDHTQYPGLYAPFMSPRYVANGGRTIYFTLSLWDPYNVFWFSADLVRSD